MKVAVSHRIYPPANRCIYCLAGHGPFTLEHIIPRGLWGALEFPAASCDDCQRKIERFEARVQNNFLGPFRLQSGPKPRTGRRQRGRVRIVKYNHNGAHETISIPLSRYPRMLMMPELPPAQSLGWGWQEPKMIAIVNTSDLDRIAKAYGEGHGHLHKFNSIDFARLLSKIAHAYAVAEIPSTDLMGFSLMLPKIIRFGLPQFPVGIIGGSIRPVYNTAFLNELSLWTAVTTKFEYIVGTVRLYAALGAPAYDVVVAKRPLTTRLLAPNPVFLGSP